MSTKESGVCGPFVLRGEKGFELRGENPHQPALWYPTNLEHLDALGGTLLQEGKTFGVVNFLDMDSAFRAVAEFEGPTVCISKHASPCGLASADTIANAFRAAFECDTVSAFGGVVAANGCIDVETVEAMHGIKGLFLECLVAPAFEPAALEMLQAKKKMRILQLPLSAVPKWEARTVIGGIIWQQADRGDPPGTQWEVVSQRQPTEDEWTSLRFAWKACRSVVSNAIVLAQGTALVGIGGGHPNRRDSVKTSCERAGARAKGSVLASDAFFPFPDGVHLAAAAGITAIVWTGGSVKDADVIAVADASKIAMVKTGVRHFRH